MRWTQETVSSNSALGLAGQHMPEGSTSRLGDLPPRPRVALPRERLSRPAHPGQPKAQLASQTPLRRRGLRHWPALPREHPSRPAQPGQPKAQLPSQPHLRRQGSKPWPALPQARLPQPG